MSRNPLLTALLTAAVVGSMVVGSLSLVAGDARAQDTHSEEAAERPTTRRRGAAPVERVLVSRRGYLDAFDSILVGLDRARALALDAPRRQVDHELVEEIERAHDRLVRLQRRLRRAPVVQPEPPVIVEETVSPLVAFADPDFLAFLRQVKRAAFDDDRMLLLREVVKHRAFTTTQVIDVLDEVSFEKVEAAVLLYPNVVDPESFVRVYDELNFTSDRRELAERLERLRTDDE